MRHMAVEPSDLATAEAIANRSHRDGDETPAETDGEAESADSETDRTE